MPNPTRSAGSHSRSSGLTYHLTRHFTPRLVFAGILIHALVLRAIELKWKANMLALPPCTPGMTSDNWADYIVCPSCGEDFGTLWSSTAVAKLKCGKCGEIIERPDN